MTHAGIYGIDMSINTIEELLDININYYFRVNFTTLENIIDAIGGVDVYSEYSFVSYIGSYQFYKGYNHMNGNQALGFARERKTLPEGDISRAKNQQAVIDGIIRKLTSFSSITKYSNVINSLKDTFQTNMTDNDITSLIKMQLNDNASWNITSNVLSGTGASEYTYSYKGQKLYVMIPDDSSVNDAIVLINQVVSGQMLDGSYDKEATDIKNPDKVYTNSGNNNSNDKKEEATKEPEEIIDNETPPVEDEPQVDDPQIDDPSIGDGEDNTNDDSQIDNPDTPVDDNNNGSEQTPGNGEDSSSSDNSDEPVTNQNSLN